MYLTLASKLRIVVQVVGDLILILDESCLLELKDCLYVLESRNNLISISSLCKLNCSMVFFFHNKLVFIKLNGSLICLGSLVDHLYPLYPLFIFPSNENYHVSQKRKEPSINQTQLWHLCLVHINLNRIQILVKSRILSSLIPEYLPIYESCIKCKMTDSCPIGVSSDLCSAGAP